MLSGRHPRVALGTEWIAGAFIFLVTLLVFWFSPVHQITDSHYSMLLSENLLKHRSFALDHYNIPRLQPNVSTRDYYVMNGDIWQLELAGGHIYYYFPPGSSLLSLPYVAAANALGLSAANQDSTYNPRGEAKIETSLAAVLMALLAVIFFLTSRLLLPPVWSVIIAFTGTFATQIWSTASRGLWSHTWATFLMGIVVWILVSDETGRRKINPIVLGSLLAWLYFVRPSGSVVVIAVSSYILLFDGKRFLTVAVTGAVWLAAFMTYSWMHFGKLLPSYYQANRLRLDLFPVALLGNLISPSRGLLIYVPAIIVPVYLLVRYWRYVAVKRLVWLSLFICAFHILLVSAFANLWGDWWGGASFGPRYSTELVPWLVLLAIIGINARLKSSDVFKFSTWRYSGEIVAGLLLVGFSVFINARGATSLDTWKWSQPSTDQQLRARLWDWRHPQFLAGLQSSPPPPEFPLVTYPTAINLTSPESNKYLWYGWSGAEKNFRWTDGKEATVVFRLNEPRDTLLDLTLGPFVANPQPAQQRLIVKLNDQLVESFTLPDGISTYTVKLSGNLLRSNNVLIFDLPDATSPQSLGVGPDDRVLGVRVESMRFRSAE